MEIESHNIMFSTTELDKLLGALAKAQGEFDIPKKSHDGYHGKYANLQDLKNATQKQLASNGLSITQSHDQSTIKSMLGHASGQHIVYITKYKDNPSDKFKQASAWTFMRRYAIMAILNVSGDEDPESYGEVSFTPDDGLSEESQTILDGGLRTKKVEEFNQYYGANQFKLKRLEKDDNEEYKFIEKHFKIHKDSLKGKKNK